MLAVMPQIEPDARRGILGPKPARDALDQKAEYAKED